MRIHVHHHFEQGHEILALLRVIHRNQDLADHKLEKIMQTVADLTTAVADLQTEVTDIGTEMDALLAALVAAQGANDPVAVDAAVTAIRAQIDALKSAGTRDMPPATP